MYGLAQGLLAALLFGASTPASKLLLGEFGPFALAGLLYVGAALAMIPVVLRERRRPERRRLDRLNALRLAGAVAFGGVAGPVLLLLALELALAGSVSLLLNLELAATAALGVLFFREHLGRGAWLGVLGIVLAGALLALDAGWPGVAAALLVAAACVCWGLDNHWTARIDGLTPAGSTFWKGSVAGSTNLAIGLVVGPFSTRESLLATALVVGALSYGASIALYIRSAQQIGATRAQAAFASAPFVGALLSLVVLGEPLGITHAVAGSLLLVSLVLLALGRHEHLHTHEELWHIHSHRHDDGHHGHEHPGLDPRVRHTHWHRHERLEHAHPHWPDLHHRHRHD